VFAIWYLFDPDDENYLTKIINNLAKKYNSPSFVPHITAYGLVDIDLETLDQKIFDSIHKIQPFTIETSAINFSDDFWKTFYVEILLNKNFVKINNDLTINLSKFSKYHFLPHISLLYKNMGQSQKQFLKKNIHIKKTFTITGIGIQQFSEKIEDWKLVKEYLFK